MAVVGSTAILWGGNNLKDFLSIMIHSPDFTEIRDDMKYQQVTRDLICCDSCLTLTLPKKTFFLFE